MKFELNEDDVLRAASDAVSTADILNKLGIKPHGRYYRPIRNILQKHGLVQPRKWAKRKWNIITKTCPVCQVIFDTTSGSRDEKTVCSRGCANTFFRTGENAGNYKHGNGVSYRKTTMMKRLLTTECHRCSYNKIPDVLHVHHKDRNRTNNSPDNIEILCPTCHAEEHFLMRDGPWSNRKEKQI